jgi:uncharacterized protein (DUF362 family)
MRCDAYDPDKIAGIIKEGMQELGVKPSGKVLLKPNVVIAHPETFPNAFTRSEFLDGALAAVKDRAVDAKEIAVQTCLGAAQLLHTNKKHPEQEIDRVTTPMGCTIAGLNEMEHHGLSSALIKGLATSYQRIEDMKNR